MFGKKLVVAIAMISAIWNLDLAQANDGALYEKAIDPNAAFVRVLSVDQVAVRIHRKSFSNLDDGVSPYVVVDPGDVSLSIGSAQRDLSVQSGKFYSVIYRGGQDLEVIEDTVSATPSKANLSFYNLTKQNVLDLFVPQAKAKAISGLAQNKGKTVQIKAPLTLDFAASINGEAKATAPKVQLSRGSGMTLVALEKDGQFSLLAVKSKIVK